MKRKLHSLCSLPPSLDNVVDNLQTKLDLTYDQVFARLLDLNVANKSNSADDKAYSSNQGDKGKNRDNGKECTWCKSKKDNFKGHLYTECRKLKAHQKNKKEKKEASAKQTTEISESTAFMAREFTEATASAFMATSGSSGSSQPSKSWFFDTAASSHMTSDKNTLTDFRKHGGIVRVANSQSMEVTGIGKVQLQCRLQNGSALPATLDNVLLVPELDSHGLFSWAAVRRKGFRMIGEDDDIVLETKAGKKVLWAKMEDNDPVIQLVENKARFTSYFQWHEALAHSSKLNPDLYADGHLLPKIPKCKTWGQ